MGTQVDASTITAGMLFSTSRFHVPDFQREYSWQVEDQVKEFWNDISAGMTESPYFLGLIILTDGDPLTIIDGQQRMITLTLLANALRIVAEEQSAPLVAETMRDMFLSAPNYESGKREPRLKLTAAEDRRSLERVLQLSPNESVPELESKNMEEAQKHLLKKMRDSVDRNLGKWATYLTSGIQFAQFLHPNSNAAFKVFEIVNTRGRELTPAELIKSYLISKVASTQRKKTYDRWRTIERQLRESPSATLTQFVRHAETLRNGYVIPRDLYEAINKHYTTPESVNEFISYLEEMLPFYARVTDPWSDATDSDYVSRALTTFDTLGIRTVRPLFLALLATSAPKEHYQDVLKVVVPRVVVGQFGTGAIERLFADVARSVYLGDSGSLRALGEIQPPASEFTRRVREGTHNKGTLHVVRASVKQRTVLPDIHGTVHLVRPRYAEWSNFSDEEFRTLGSTVGNTFLSNAERRPQGTNTLPAVIERLLPTRTSDEDVQIDFDSGWPASRVRQENSQIANVAKGLFYA